MDSQAGGGKREDGDDFDHDSIYCLYIRLREGEGLVCLSFNCFFFSFFFFNSGFFYTKLNNLNVMVLRVSWCRRYCCGTD